MNLEDGTPVEDVVAELRELKAEVQEFKRAFRAITNICNAPHWESKRRWAIERVASDALKGKFDRINKEVR